MSVFQVSSLPISGAKPHKMKMSEGFSKLIASVLIFVFYAASFVPLTFALKKIDVSIAYAVWSGFGTALITMIGIFISEKRLPLLSWQASL